MKRYKGGGRNANSPTNTGASNSNCHFTGFQIRARGNTLSSRLGLANPQVMLWIRINTNIWLQRKAGGCGGHLGRQNGLLFEGNGWALKQAACGSRVKQAPDSYTRLKHPAGTRREHAKMNIDVEQHFRGGALAASPRSPLQHQSEARANRRSSPLEVEAG